MTKTWDTTINVVATPQPYGWTNQRTVEYSVAAGNVNIYIDAAGDLYYRYGDDNNFLPAANVGQQLTGVAGILGHNVNPILNASLSVDQNNDHVHIIYTDGTDVWHCEIIAPAAPQLPGSWTGFGGPLFQVVTTNGNVIGTCDVFVDSANGAGGDEPCVTWDETNAGVQEVWFNYPNAAGHTFNAPPAAIQISPVTGQHAMNPTITVNWVTGRNIYIWYNQVVAAAADTIDGMCVLDPANPLVAVNWGGPLAGAGLGPDVVLTATGGAGGSFPPTNGVSTAWWSDAVPNQARIALTVVDALGVVQSEMWNEQIPAYVGPWTNAGYAGVAQFATLQNVLSNDFRILVQNGNGRIDHCRKATQPDMGGGDSWYQLATTLTTANDPHNSEWRGIEHADAALAWKRTHCVFNSFAPMLYFSQARENTSTAPDNLSPTGGEYVNELNALPFAWAFNDTETDGQREYYVEIDDDVGFGSPVADPGTNLRLSTWTVDPGAGDNLNASTLTTDTTYYWHVKTRDDQYGTEYDPYSETSYSGTSSFKTTAPITINVASVTQQADKTVDIDFTLTLPAGMFPGVAELWIAGGANLGAEYDDGAWAEMAENAGDHSIGVPGAIDITGGTTYCTFSWAAESDLAANYEANVNVRFTVRYLNDDHGQGTSVDTSNNHFIDFDDPDSVTLGVPSGLTVTTPLITLNCTAVDPSGYMVKFQIADNAGFTPVHETSGWVDGTSWVTTVPMDHAGTWHFRAITKDKCVSENENPAYSAGASFDYDPPPMPILCVDGSWSLEIDPTKTWTGGEFDVLDDCVEEITFKKVAKGPHTLEFTLNNYNGRYMDPSSASYIKKGDEVKMVRSTQQFYGAIRELRSDTEKHRTVEVVCESWSAIAEAYPIQVRVRPTATSDMYWEDAVRQAMTSVGLIPNWFTMVDENDVEIFLDTEVSKTRVLGGNTLTLNKVPLIKMLTEFISRTGKTWYEGSDDPPTGRKAYLYIADEPDPANDDADYTFYIEVHVLAESLDWDLDSLVNVISFSDADVMEQDMESKRRYGAHLFEMTSGGVKERSHLIEMAQYVLHERSTPRAVGTVPLVGEHDVAVNSLVQIWDDTESDDVKSGFDGKYIIVGVTYAYGTNITTSLTLTSRWENPLVKEIMEAKSAAGNTAEDSAIVVVRIETGEAKLETPTDGVTLNTEAVYVVGRIGFDRYSDEDTDADYYTVYGFEDGEES